MKPVTTKYRRAHAIWFSNFEGATAKSFFEYIARHGEIPGDGLEDLLWEGSTTQFAEGSEQRIKVTCESWQRHG